VGGGVIQVTNLNSAREDTSETQISFHVTKIMFTGCNRSPRLINFWLNYFQIPLTESQMVVSVRGRQSDVKNPQQILSFWGPTGTVFLPEL
jgi:hypothetical protein